MSMEINQISNSVQPIIKKNVLEPDWIKNLCISPNGLFKP